mgnify:CR=1 FL=1
MVWERKTRLIKQTLLPCVPSVTYTFKFLKEKNGMKKQSFIYGMLMATSFLACENELPFRDKPQGPQLLMNAFLEAGKEKNEVFLHIVDGNGTTSFLEGAIIVYVK